MTESPGRLHRGGQHAEDGESIGSTTRPPYRRPANFWATRWPSRPVVRITRRRNHAQARRNTFIQVREGVYDYAPTTGVAGAEEWHLNFADPRLFTAYGAGLSAQDGMQVAEHPALGALREALHARRWPALTEERGAPTPVLVRGVRGESGADEFGALSTAASCPRILVRSPPLIRCAG